MLRKNHPLFHEINRVIVEESVSLVRIYNKYISNAKPSVCDQNVRGPKALGLTPFYGILLIFLIGLAFGAGSFGVELLIKWRTE